MSIPYSTEHNTEVRALIRNKIAEKTLKDVEDAVNENMNLKDKIINRINMINFSLRANESTTEKKEKEKEKERQREGIIRTYNAFPRQFQ